MAMPRMSAAAAAAARPGAGTSLFPMAAVALLCLVWLLAGPVVAVDAADAAVPTTAAAAAAAAAAGGGAALELQEFSFADELQEAFVAGAYTRSHFRST
jgi:hypothetical protein